MDIVISAAAHRSGSTLLQRIVNSRKENLIWGEHRGVLTDFLDIYKKVRHYSMDFRRERQAYFESEENPNTWIATMTPEHDYVERAMVESVRAFLDSLYAQFRDTHDRIGFKEVRYGELELKLLRKCYPQAAFLLLVRHPVATWRSLVNCRGWYKEDAAETADRWSRNASGYLSFAEKDSLSHLIRYEDLVAGDPATLRTVAETAGLSEDRIRDVLGSRIGSTARTGDRIAEEDLAALLERCREPMRRLGYDANGEVDGHGFFASRFA
ncbi:sulfotransferase [Cohnella suwonensis]|uniref:Sulfotransferase n=1 Tax=Cohnella suwonensis TaxID=696072 RepID=A0ABW0LSW9_9BACL